MPLDFNSDIRILRLIASAWILFCGIGFEAAIYLHNETVDIFFYALMMISCGALSVPLKRIERNSFAPEFPPLDFKRAFWLFQAVWLVGGILLFLFFRGQSIAGHRPSEWLLQHILFSFLLFEAAIFIQGTTIYPTIFQSIRSPFSFLVPRKWKAAFIRHARKRSNELYLKEKRKKGALN